MSDNKVVNDYTNTSAEVDLKKAQLKNTLFILAIVLCVVGGILFHQWSLIANLEYIDGNVLKIARTGNASVGNPWKTDSFVTQLAYASLFETDAGFTEVNPALAETVSMSEDGLTYTITLKEGLKWSDGEPLTVDDVVFSIESFVLCASTQTTITTAFSRIVGLDEWKEVGVESWENGGTYSLAGVSASGNEVTITLDSPHKNFMLALTQFIPLPKHEFKDTDPSTITSGLEYFTHPIGSGMYVVDCINEDGDLELVHNSYYYGKHSDIERVILYGNYQNMHIDYYATSTVSEMVSYRSMPGFEEYGVDVEFYRYFTFNLMAGYDQPEMLPQLDADGNEMLDEEGNVIYIENTEPVEYDENRPENLPMQNVLLRQAISLALDRQTYLKDVYFDTGKVDFTSTGGAEYAEFLLDYNPTEAKRLLQESGYDLSRPLTIGHYHTDPNSVALLSRVQSALEDIGFTVIIKKVSGTELYVEREYDFYLKAYAAYNFIDWYNEYLTTNTSLFAVIGTDEFDELLKELDTTTDESTYQVVLKKIQDLDSSTMYKIPVVSTEDTVYINSNRIFVPDDMEFGNIRYRSALRLDEWYVKKG